MMTYALGVGGGMRYRVAEICAGRAVSHNLDERAGTWHDPVYAVLRAHPSGIGKRK